MTAAFRLFTGKERAPAQFCGSQEALEDDAAVVSVDAWKQRVGFPTVDVRPLLHAHQGGKVVIVKVRHNEAWLAGAVLLADVKVAVFAKVALVAHANTQLAVARAMPCRRFEGKGEAVLQDQHLLATHPPPPPPFQFLFPRHHNAKRTRTFAISGTAASGTARV